MKIKMVKQSGNAVDLDQFAAYEEEFSARYDVIVLEYGRDMKVVHDKLEELDAELASKYDTIIEIERPKSGKQEKALVDKYGQYMVTTHMETGELIYVILDMGI